MVKRYEGNSGRVVRLEEPPSPMQERRPSPPPEHRPPPPGPRPAGPPRETALPRQLRQLLTGTLGELETEDLLLLLILYLLYRESGDQDWLVTLGAMLFL